jgi:hypothetical protein
MRGSNEQDSGIKLTTKHFALRISYEAFQVALRTFISLILLVTLGYPMHSVSHCEQGEYGTQGYRTIVHILSYSQDVLDHL